MSRQEYDSCLSTVHDSTLRGAGCDTNLARQPLDHATGCKEKSHQYQIDEEQHGC